MFSSILRISAPNVLKLFLNMIVSIGCPVVIFYSYKPTGRTNTLPWPTRKKYDT